MCSLMQTPFQSCLEMIRIFTGLVSDRADRCSTICLQQALARGILTSAFLQMAYRRSSPPPSINRGNGGSFGRLEYAHHENRSREVGRFEKHRACLESAARCQPANGRMAHAV